ncbi:pyridoxal kinase [Culicoides brevitarsis]|uniref:pyridoxal kinase n=1 Tax=Culicoides brevitarsis TaxID=469753 RepID=UPI00307B46E9
MQAISIISSVNSSRFVATLSCFARKMSSSTQNLQKRVLSIQSHVVHGYVGNKSATFPLQLLGFEVDAINSVQFSCHTGYKVFKGQVLNETQLDDVFNGLVANDLHSKYTHLLTGYVGNVNFLQNIGAIIKKLRETNPNLVYLCDPVMGDDDFMYVPKELLPIYRDEIVPLSNISTPNQFEAELLTDVKIKEESDVWKACQWFHEKGVSTVVLSSTTLGNEKELLAYLSHRTNKNESQQYILSIPKVEGIRFTGTGDLFAALFMAHASEKDVGEAFEKTIASLQAVIRRTYESVPEEVKKRERKALPWERELKIVQSKRDIEEPKVELKARKL